MNDLISTFCSWIKEHETTLGFQLNEPADNKAIDYCQNTLGFEFPDQLRNLYLQFNGQDWVSKNGIFYDYSFSPLEKLIETVTMFEDGEMPSREELVMDGLWENDTVKSYTYCDRWIPFGQDHSGLCLSLDFDPGVNGKTGQVICNGDDVEKNKVVNHNFDDFLAWYVDRLQTGKFYIGEPDGIYDEPAIEFRVKRGTHFISK